VPPFQTTLMTLIRVLKQLLTVGVLYSPSALDPALDCWELQAAHGRLCVPSQGQYLTETIKSQAISISYI
jgi:hypothetical protein